MIKVNPLLSEGAEFYCEVPRRNERLKKRIQKPGGRPKPEEINPRMLGCALTVTLARRLALGPGFAAPRQSSRGSTDSLQGDSSA